MGLVRGHLHVGIELYKNQYFDNAKRHMKHPKSELYSAMIPTFEAKNADGFASELEDLALTVESDKDLNLVLSKYEILLNAITENEKIVDTEKLIKENEVNIKTGFRPLGYPKNKKGFAGYYLREKSDDVKSFKSINTIYSVKEVGESFPNLNHLKSRY